MLKIREGTHTHTQIHLSLQCTLFSVENLWFINSKSEIHNFHSALNKQRLHSLQRQTSRGKADSICIDSFEHFDCFLFHDCNVELSPIIMRNRIYLFYHSMTAPPNVVECCKQTVVQQQSNWECWIQIHSDPLVLF